MSELNRREMLAGAAGAAVVAALPSSQAKDRREFGFRPERLKAIREAEGLSIDGAARAVGIDAERWQGIEDGSVVPDFREGMLACELLKVSTPYLMGETD